MAEAILLFEALIGFGLPLAFAVWQLRSVNRELERDRRTAERGETEEAASGAADSVLFRALTKNAPGARSTRPENPGSDG